MREDSPSPRVRLEVALLDGDRIVPAPAAPAAHDERSHLTVLIVAAEPDLRQYVRECLRERTDLRVLEAGTVDAAVSLAADGGPDLLVVDESERAVLAQLTHLRAIVIVDDVPHDSAGPGGRVRLLARPFTGQQLMEEVGRLLD